MVVNEMECTFHYGLHNEMFLLCFCNQRRYWSEGQSFAE